MGNIFYLLGIILAGIAGYSDLPWYFIFISSFIMVIGYSIIRAPQIHNVIAQDGSGAIPKPSQRPYDIIITRCARVTANWRLLSILRILPLNNRVLNLRPPRLLLKSTRKR